MRRSSALLLGALLLAVAACSDVSSDKVTTGDLDVTMLLTADGDGIKVSVTLLQNFHTVVGLSPGDELVASSGGDSTTLSGADGHYNGRLDVAPEPGTEVTVALNREAADDAPSSTATLPEPVQILSPAPRASFNPDDELVITVDDAPGDLHVTWTGSCVQVGDDIDRQATISGSTITLPAKAVQHSETQAKTCLVVFNVTRDHEGTVDDAFDKGSIAGRQHLELPLRLRQRDSA